MQRRAVAIYLVFFVVLGAAAYGLVLTTSAPDVSVDGPTYQSGADVTFGDRTYDLSVSGGSGELSWENESAVFDTTLDNGSVVPPTGVVWDGQTARREATFDAGSTVAYNASEYAVSVNDTAGTMTLTNPDDPADNTTVEVGSTFEYRGFEATVTAVSGDGATVVWGNGYRLVTETENVTDPTEATLVEQRNLTQLAVLDPALYDEVNDVNGTRVVTYRENDTNVRVSEHFDPAERHTIAEGETLVYQGNETTVHQVDNESVVLRRSGTATETISLSEGGNITVGGQQYFAHFPSDSSVRILPADERYDEYRASLDQVDEYNERVRGFWGIVDLSIAAVIVLVATALLPVRG
ncbi:MAG: hypothetical protein V5A44_06355 [Haloarculaceae archaeon]